MRIGYVCRDLASERLTGSGAEVYSLACAASAAGHETYLISEALARYRTQARGPVPVPLAPVRADHRYLTGSLAYADRVYDTVRPLDLDVLEFVDTGGEGATVIRARRLLGEFASTRLVVATRPDPDRPAASLAEAVDRHLADYCRRYADEVVTDRPVVAAGELLDPDAPRRPGPASAVWFLGDAGPELDTLTAALAEPGAPELEVVLRGVAPPSPVPPRSIVVDGPLRPADLASPPPLGTVCVLPVWCAPAAARLALALGLRVIAFAGSTAAQVVAEGGGALVPQRDPPALCAVLSATLPSDARPVTVFAPPAPAPPAAPLEVAEPELVSVVIPVRDQGHYLAGAVESARHCGYRPVEVIVVDDGSTEPETLAVLDELTGVTLLRQPHGGLPAARNAGIAAARGRYLVPLDADDLLPAGFVEPAVAALARHPELGGVGGRVRNFGLLDQVSTPVGYVPDVSLVVNTFGRATAVLRAEAVAACGGYDPGLPGYEDWDLYLRLHKAGYVVEYAPLVGQLYRRHEQSMTFQQDERTRVALTQHILRTHADLLTDGGALPLLLTLVDLWKSRYEPSASVAWRQRDGLALAAAAAAE
jgi:GT2 family glycosyltransferase